MSCWFCSEYDLFRKNFNAAEGEIPFQGVQTTSMVGWRVQSLLWAAPPLSHHTRRTHPPPCSPSLWMVSVRTKRPMSKQTWVEQGWVWEREKDTLNPGWFGQRSWKSTQCDNMCICALQYSPKCQLGDTLCCNALSYVAAFLQCAPDNGSRFHWKKQLRNTAKKFQIHICRILTRIKLRCFFSLYFAPPPLLAPNLSWSYSDESNCVSASTSDGEEVVLHLQRVLVCILLLFVQRVLVYLVCTIFVPRLWHVFVNASDGGEVTLHLQRVVTGVVCGRYRCASWNGCRCACVPSFSCSVGRENMHIYIHMYIQWER